MFGWMLHPKGLFSKRLFEQTNKRYTWTEEIGMSKKPDQKHAEEYLKQMIVDKPADEPIEKTLSTFCQRYGVSMGECQVYYNKLVKKTDNQKK
jgi:hypothetical protein